MNNQNNKIVWEAHEFRVYNKSPLWYLIFGLIALGLIAYAAYTRDLIILITFGVIIVAAYFYSRQKPGLIRYELSTTGVHINQMFYPYRNIRKFWVFYTPENKSLNFETTAYLNNRISLELGKQDPVQIRTFLKSYLQEDLNIEESFMEVISRKIKF